jgi:hypothetical protein
MVSRRRATARACAGARLPWRPVSAGYLRASKRMGEIEDKSIERTRDIEFDLILRYINFERETLAYLLREIRRY